MKSRKNLISIELEKRAQKELEELPQKYQIQVLEAIESLKVNPLAGGKLSGEHRYLRRLRVGIYRIIYTFKAEKLLVLVLHIGHRKDIYRRYQ